MHNLTPVREWHDVDAECFRAEVQPLNRPAILRGLVAQWPAVRKAHESPQALASYLLQFDAGHPIISLNADASIKGRFFYNEDMTGLNFTRRKEPFPEAMQRLISLLAIEEPPATYIQSTPIPEYLPRFAQEHPVPLLPSSVPGRIWIGNAITVQTHFDLNENIACVVAGRRRFTLFPPEQIANLYVGPFDFTLSGPPVSMVSLHEPDFERYPRFREALAAAQVAELEPGDALYIPYFWWHHVESLTPFNVLVNYWWNPARPSFAAPFDALLHSVLAIRELPENQREAWRAVFDYLVFQRSGEPLAHLAPQQRGMLGPLTPERAREMRAVLLKILSR